MTIPFSESPKTGFDDIIDLFTILPQYLEMAKDVRLGLSNASADDLDRAAQDLHQISTRFEALWQYLAGLKGLEAKQVLGTTETPAPLRESRMSTSLSTNDNLFLRELRALCDAGQLLVLSTLTRLAPQAAPTDSTMQMEQHAASIMFLVSLLEEQKAQGGLPLMAFVRMVFPLNVVARTAVHPAQGKVTRLILHRFCDANGIPLMAWKDL